MVGGDRLTYAEDTCSPTTDIIETNILLNSVISDANRGARFLSLNLKAFYLVSPMDDPEFMKVHISKFPADIIEKYDLNAIVTPGSHVYIKINKEMYGLYQAVILAYDQLKTFMEKNNYYPEPHTVEMWSHKTRHTKIYLGVDDFCIKYYGKDGSINFNKWS